MKKAIFALSLLAMCALAKADLIPTPNNFSLHESSETIRDQKKAGDLYASLPESNMTNFLQCNETNYRVQTTNGGLQQTVCTSSFNSCAKDKPAPQYECTITTSKDGKPVKPFVFPHAMG